MCRQQAASYLGRLISMSLAWAAQPRIQPFARLAIPGIFGGFQEGLPVVQPQLLRWTSAPPLLEAILVVCTHVDIYPLSFQLFPHFSFRFNKAAIILLRRRRFETYIRPAFTSWTCGICIFIRYYWTCDYFSGGWLFCLYHLFFFKFFWTHSGWTQDSAIVLSALCSGHDHLDSTAQNTRSIQFHDHLKDLDHFNSKPLSGKRLAIIQETIGASQEHKFSKSMYWKPALSSQ